MKIAYIRVSKADGNQTLDLQKDAILAEGVQEQHIYQDFASGKKENRPGLENCLKALREGDTLVVWKLDRLGRDLKHLVNLVQDLSDKKVSFKVLTGQGATIDTSTAAGKFIFGVFASLAEFERDLIRERTMAGLQSARARGKKGGRRFQLTKSQIRFISTTMQDKNTNVSELCKEMKISSSTLYRYVSPDGELREYAKKVLAN